MDRWEGERQPDVEPHHGIPLQSFRLAAKGIVQSPVRYGDGSIERSDSELATVPMSER